MSHHPSFLLLVLALAWRAVAQSAETPAAAFIGAPSAPPAAKASPLTPEEQRASFTVPPGFEIELVAAEEPGIGKFVTVDFDQRGRMWSMTAFDYPVDANEDPEAAKALYSQPGKDKVLVWDKPFAPGPQTPRVFADGLAIPLGILPFKDGCYVQHGPNIAYLGDTDGDGKADQRDVVLTGFGVQDSHLFPHQFTRAPGGWIWMAQGAFNSGRVKVRDGSEQQFDQTRMARFRANGSRFEIMSQGPCNIWGLVLTGEGEAFIQEANDYGYPVMPFHEGANYPGCSDQQMKSYAPMFPGTAPHFKMGGTGLSGLALSDARGAWPAPYADVMYVANPITRQIQAIKITPDGPRHRYEKLPDFIHCSDDWFRPVAIKFGPDGCLYIVDWYNKIISHNEVPRAHPDRDKTRGRIWRVKHKDQTGFPMPDFTALTADELLAKLGGDSLAQSHLAWQTISDRGEMEALVPKLEAIIRDPAKTAAQRIQSMWALFGIEGGRTWTLDFPELAKDPNRNVRREFVRMERESGYTPGEKADWLAPLTEDPDPEVRAEVIRALGADFLGEVRRNKSGGYESRYDDSTFLAALKQLVRMAKAPLAEPVAPNTRDGKPVKVREAYEREFERYLIRQALEQRPDLVAQFLDSAEADQYAAENRMVAALAMEQKPSARAVARLLPQLARAPAPQEMLRLAEAPAEPGVAEALRTVLRSSETRTAALEALLTAPKHLDPAPIAPLLADAARQLFAGSEAERALALRAASAFKLASLEPELVQLLGAAGSPEQQLAALRT